MIEAGDINVENWEAALNEVSRHSPKIVVPGHGNLGGAEIADQVRAYLGQVRRIVTSTGVVNPEALNQLVKMIREQNPIWERTEFIAPAVKYFAANRSG